VGSTGGWSVRSEENCLSGSINDPGKAGMETSHDHSGVSKPVIAGPVFASTATRRQIPVLP